MDCWWACVCAFVPAEPSIDDTHVTGLHKAVSTLQWNTCSAAQQVIFYNFTQNKSVLQHYCFQPLCNDWGGVRVVFMENLAVTDMIKGQCLTLSPVQAWPAASVATCCFSNRSNRFIRTNRFIFLSFPSVSSPLLLLLLLLLHPVGHQQDTKTHLNLGKTDVFTGELVSISHLIGGLFHRLWSGSPAWCCYRKQSSTNLNPYWCLLNCTRATASITAVLFKRNEGILMLGCIFYQINTQFK